ncbi:uncharacterized protein LOC142625312 [Castanea sativa]|uniref:uncharacterized protein LOC142625312 n=1 Tax=Castanea sativa TaxID=21020 RepID=UPI003F649624
MAMREGETLRTYSDRYWEIFNEIDGDFDDVAIRTFKVGLPTEHDLRKSLTKKPVRSVRRLMDRIDEYKRLVKEGRLKQFLYQPNGQRNHLGVANHSSTSLRPLLGTINVIFAAPGRTGSNPSRVMSVARTLAEESRDQPKMIKANILPILGFSKEEKIGTIQPHDDALVVTLRIGEYDVRRVMVDQGSGVDIMYPNLFKGLNLKLEDLTAYDSPLISFEGKVVIPKGQIRLPVQSGPEVVGKLLGSQSVARQCVTAAILR